MNQKISDLAGVANIAASLAVVVTVIVLVAEIRQSTNVTRASMYATMSGNLIENRMRRTQDPEFNELWVKYARNEGNGINDEERTLLTPYVQSLFQVYDAAYVARQYDLLGDPEWSRFESIACLNYRRVRNATIVDPMAAVTSNDFWDYLEATCR